jgi:serine/threonine-protein kinase
MATHDEHLFALQAALAGQYSFERELGRGGMGVVHLAREVALDRLVAIKVLHPELADRPEQRERFLREARTGARLAHPHIVPIYAVGEAAGTVYFVMAFVDGESVRARLHREGPLDPATTSRIVMEAGQALAHAHAMGVLHRDVTLDNILLERSTGRALLADFGIASEVEHAGNAPLIGTPAYLAPELVQGDPPSPRSDLYALGIAAWTMLTGRLPFPDDAPAKVLIHQVTAPIPPLEEAAAGTPGTIRRAVMRALAKDPAERPADVESWLQEWTGGQAARALAAPLRHWLDRWSRVRIFYALAMSATAMLGTIGGSFNTPWLPLAGVWQLIRIAAFIVPAVLILHDVMDWRGLRALAREGYRIEDLRLAMAERKREAMAEPRRHAPFLSRIVCDLVVLAGGLWFALGAIVLPNLYRTQGYGEAKWLIGMAMSLLRISYLVFWTGLGFTFIMPPFRPRPDGWLARLRERYWNSRLAERRFALAALFLPRDRGTPHTLHRPTELALDLAIEDLWRALPDAGRRRLAEVPVVARRLRTRIGAVRDLARRLDPAGGNREAVRALADDLRARERAALGALERLRLGLLTLTDEAAPTGELTEAIRGARALEAGLLVDLGADLGVANRLATSRPPSESPITPAPSPA